jgi:hypothetical protein
LDGELADDELAGLVCGVGGLYNLANDEAINWGVEMISGSVGFVFDWAHAATHVGIKTCEKRLDEEPVLRRTIDGNFGDRLNCQVLSRNWRPWGTFLKIKPLLEGILDD